MRYVCINTTRIKKELKRLQALSASVLAAGLFFYVIWQRVPVTENTRRADVLNR